ncbi:histidine kinase [Microtetraspora sp. NBRC 13810]|uniref:PAS domain-containing sensor histidine kinase n=1 Tax=Microtetraspora sp. NBRC 13810 TaxID=3030990 RepID=UPI0024A4BA9D|nr:PAS domain S-box protein [Microtetraspora sp. NBRC 13810]GLW07172.1 histidine kinase [Microtetraspora sp. NBRC 13810]
MPDSSSRPSRVTDLSERDARLLLDNIVDYAIFMLDREGRIVSWSAGAERIKGYAAQDIIGRHFSVFYPPEDIAADKPRRELETAVAEGRLEDEGWRLRNDGTRFWANVVITALYDQHGELRGFGKVTRDMTERRMADLALRDSEDRFRLMVQNVVDYAIFMLDRQGHIVSWNAGAERIKGYAAQDIIGRHFSVFYPPEDIAADKPRRELETAVAEGRLEDEGWRLRNDGTRFWANVVITALYDQHGELRGFGKVTRDMTERRTAERALDERGKLLTHLVHAQELERRRIAWDVHDDTIQSMVAVGMRLQLLAGGLPAEHEDAVLRLNETVTAAIGRLRNLTFHLRPPEIERDGLVAALSGYLKQTTAGTGLRYTLRHELDREPPYETAITIFRICQEALTNVRKHAHASRVTLTLSSVDHGVTVRLADDGAGFARPLDAVADTGHFGLIEMRERAETAGGWWSIRGVPGNGTTVEFWLPALWRGEENRLP